MCKNHRNALVINLFLNDFDILLKARFDGDNRHNVFRLNAKAQPLLDQFSKYSYTDCDTDAQGRLLLPQKLRAWRLGDARDVEVNGTYNHIRIIPAAVGKDQDRAFDEKYPDPLAFLTSLQD